MTKISHAFIISAAALLAGCSTTVDQDAAFRDVRDTVGKRTGQELAWRRDAAVDADIAAKLRKLTEAELTLESATQVALFNNRALQARYADIGVAQADLAEAGLLSNPVLSFMARPTTNPAEGTILEFAIAQSLLDVFFRPARVRAAKAEFAEARTDVAGAVIETITTTRKAYISAVGARNAAAVARQVAEAAETSWRLAERFHAAGNLSDLELAEEQALHEDAVTEVEDAELEAIKATETLAAALNLASSDLKLPEVLPGLPPADPALEDAENIALSQRLDVAAKRAASAARLEQLKYKTDTRLWQEIGLEVAAEREPDGQWAIGPELSIALPLFDQGGPAVSRAAGALLKAENELQDLQAQARAEVRSTAAEVAAKRRMAERYRTVILPLKQNIVRLKQAENNYMLVGIFEVLIAKREETEAYLAYVNLVRDYWLARAELANAIGGSDVVTVIEGPQS